MCYISIVFCVFLNLLVFDQNTCKLPQFHFVENVPHQGFLRKQWIFSGRPKQRQNKRRRWTRLCYKSPLWEEIKKKGTGRSVSVFYHMTSNGKRRSALPGSSTRSVPPVCTYKITMTPSDNNCLAGWTFVNAAATNPPESKDTALPDPRRIIYLTGRREEEEKRRGGEEGGKFPACEKVQSLWNHLRVLTLDRSQLLPRWESTTSGEHGNSHMFKSSSDLT